VLLLIQYGADVNAKGKSGMTPLECAEGGRKKSKDIVELLRKKGGKV